MTEAVPRNRPSAADPDVGVGNRCEHADQFRRQAHRLRAVRRDRRPRQADGAPGVLPARPARPAARAVAADRQRSWRRVARGLPGPRPRRPHRVRPQARGRALGASSAPGCGSPAAASRRPTPARLLDVLEEARRSWATTPSTSTTWPSRPRPSSKIDRGPGRARAGQGLRGSSTRSRSGRRPRTSVSSTRPCTQVLDEQQVFRIDHFLGKEGTQNLHALRFGNGLFDHVWPREHVRAVQIDVPETLDIDDRAEFYDETGAFLDMIVTHLFQVAAEVAMEPPLSMAAEDLQAARESVIAAFRPLRPRGRRLRASSRATPTPRASPPTRRPTRSSRPGCGSTPTGGAACRSCCGPASSWRRASSRSSLVFQPPRRRTVAQGDSGPGQRADREAVRLRARSTCGWWSRSRAPSSRSPAPRPTCRWPTSTTPTRCRRTSS